MTKYLLALFLALVPAAAFAICIPGGAPTVAITAPATQSFSAARDGKTDWTVTISNPDCVPRTLCYAVNMKTDAIGTPHDGNDLGFGSTCFTRGVESIVPSPEVYSCADVDPGTRVVNVHVGWPVVMTPFGYIVELKVTDSVAGVKTYPALVTDDNIVLNLRDANRNTCAP